MAYIARYFVRVNGEMYTPGEVILAGISAENADRLLKMGAIRRNADFEDIPDYAFDDADDVDNENAGNAEDAEDAEDDMISPEIDVMDGIVDKPQAEDKPRSRRTKSEGGKEE